jgi:hypothetical protein
VELLKPQMRLEYSLEAQRLLPYLPPRMIGSPIVVTRSSIAWRFVQRAYSLSLAMGLTVILTTLALSAEMRLAPEPLSLRKIGRPRTFVATLPRSGGQGVAVVDRLRLAENRVRREVSQWC